MVPGGGVGLFNACSMQWGRWSLGVQYGGFLSSCQAAHGGITTPDAYESVRACVRAMCDRTFAGREERFDPLLRACRWFTEWYSLADNPNLRYRRVACPSVLQQRWQHMLHFANAVFSPSQNKNALHGSAQFFYV